MKLSKKHIQQIKAYLADKPVNRAYLLDYTQQIGLVFVQMKLDLEELLHKERWNAAANRMYYSLLQAHPGGYK